MTNEADVSRCITQDDRFCFLSFQCILNCQTEDELQQGRTIHQNDIGFNCNDARKAMHLADRTTISDFSKSELTEMRNMMLRYTGQLCNMLAMESADSNVSELKSILNRLSSRARQPSFRGVLYDSDDEFPVATQKKRRKVVVDEDEDSEAESIDGDATNGICDGFWSRVLSSFYDLLRRERSHDTPSALLVALGSPPGMTVQDLLTHEHHCQMALGIWRSPTTKGAHVFVYLPDYGRWADAVIRKVTSDKVVVKYVEDECDESLKGARLDYTITWTSRWIYSEF